MNEKQVELMVAKAMAKQAHQQSKAQPMQVLQNGSVNTAVNFAAEDFVKASKVLRSATGNLVTPWVDLKPGVQSFINQQIFRINAAGLVLDALGYQGVTEMLVHLNQDVATYIEQTMAVWNKVITEEGEVEKIYKAIEAEEKAQANPPQSMQ